jgi:DNA end-binding protein Ku
MRITVNAHLSFGMVNVPVGVSPSTDRSNGVTFKLLHKGCNAPIKQDRYCAKCGKEHLDPTELVKGVEVAKGQFVTWELSELAALQPVKSPVITVSAFTPAGMVAVPWLSESANWLVPNDAFAVAYATLVEAMLHAQLDAVGTHCLWGKEHLCAVVVNRGVLELHTMINPADMIKPDFKIVEAPADAVRLAVKVLKQMTVRTVNLPEMAPNDAAIRELVRAKIAGFELTPAKNDPPETTVDLMRTLRASIRKQRKEVK